jgi:putative hydrolase of the HAD superfamily
MAENLSILPPIKAVFFDAAGTLFQLRESVGESYAQVARRHGFKLDPVATNLAFHKAWKSMPEPGSPIGHEQDTSEKAWWRAVVVEVLNQFPGLEIPSVEDYFEDLFAFYASASVWHTYPETVGVLEALRQRALPCFVLSNFDARLLPVLEGLGLAEHFDGVFYSGQIGHAKPSAKVFTYALEKAKMPAQACLHVGDDPIADWKGARDAGLQVFELDRTKQDLQTILNFENLPDFSH